MATIDQFEKGGRFALWVVLAATVALVPIGAFKLAMNSARTAEQIRLDAIAQAAKEKAAKDAESKPARLMFSSLGPAMRALDESLGLVWFSNASPRAGVVCVYGVASRGSQSTTSLPTCKAVEPYETNVKLSVMFAGATMKEMCPGGSCELTIKDVPAEPEPAAVAALPAK
jgi:hypothetical protein